MRKMDLFMSCSVGSFVIISYCLVIITSSIAAQGQIRTDLPAACVCERVKENESELACVCVLRLKQTYFTYPYTFRRQTVNC